MALNLKKTPSKARNATKSSGPVLFWYRVCVCVGVGGGRRAQQGGAQKKLQQKPSLRSGARLEPQAKAVVFVILGGFARDEEAALEQRFARASVSMW